MIKTHEKCEHGRRLLHLCSYCRVLKALPSSETIFYPMKSFLVLPQNSFLGLLIARPDSFSWADRIPLPPKPVFDFILDKLDDNAHRGWDSFTVHSSYSSAHHQLV